MEFLIVVLASVGLFGLCAYMIIAGIIEYKNM